MSLAERKLDDDPLAKSFELDGLKMRITPQKDFYRGIGTILNSETAALMVADDLYNKIPPGKLYKDPDFGPSDSFDFEGSWKAMYFMEKAPPGYADPAELEWKHT